jgi:ElaB/YqjD/DUF883 family membrane-anchored ribosome-binding protein
MSETTANVPSTSEEVVGTMLTEKVNEVADTIEDKVEDLIDAIEDKVEEVLSKAQLKAKEKAEKAKGKAGKLIHKVAQGIVNVIVEIEKHGQHDKGTVLKMHHTTANALIEKGVVSLKK